MLDRLQHAVEPVGGIAHHMQDRSEHFFGQLIRAGQFEQMRRHVVAGGRGCGQMHPRRLGHARDMCVEALLGLIVDHGSDMGCGIAGIAELQLARGAGNHLDHAVGDVVLHEQQPQCRAALAGGAKRRGHDVVGGVDAAGFRNQRHDRSVLGGKRPVDCASDLGRTGKDHACDVAMGGQGRADRPVAGQ